MNLSSEFQFSFRIAFRPVQTDQSIDPIDSPLTTLHYAAGKVRLLLVEQILSKTFCRPALGGLREIRY